MSTLLHIISPGQSHIAWWRSELVRGRTFEVGRSLSAPHQPDSSGRFQPRTCVPRKRGVRSGHRRVFRVVRATALRKLRRSKVDLRLNKLKVLAQKIRADLERIDGGTGTSSSSHTAGATAHGCHGGHGQAAHVGNPTERSTVGRDERNLDGAQHEGIETGSRTVRVIGSKDSPQGATLRRTTDVVENLRVPMESQSHRSGQEVSRALGENRRPHQRCSQRRPGPRESGTEHACSCTLFWSL